MGTLMRAVHFASALAIWLLAAASAVLLVAVTDHDAVLLHPKEPAAVVAVFGMAASGLTVVVISALLLARLHIVSRHGGGDDGGSSFLAHTRKRHTAMRRLCFFHIAATGILAALWVTSAVFQTIETSALYPPSSSSIISSSSGSNGGSGGSSGSSGSSGSIVGSAENTRTCAWRGAIRPVNTIVTVNAAGGGDASAPAAASATSATGAAAGHTADVVIQLTDLLKLILQELGLSATASDRTSAPFQALASAMALPALSDPAGFNALGCRLVRAAMVVAWVNVGMLALHFLASIAAGLSAHSDELLESGGSSRDHIIPSSSTAAGKRIAQRNARRSSEKKHAFGSSDLSSGIQDASHDASHDASNDQPAPVHGVLLQPAHEHAHTHMADVIEISAVDTDLEQADLEHVDVQREHVDIQREHVDIQYGQEHNHNHTRNDNHDYTHNHDQTHNHNHDLDHEQFLAQSDSIVAAAASAHQYESAARHQHHQHHHQNQHQHQHHQNQHQQHQHRRHDDTNQRPAHSDFEEQMLGTVGIPPELVDEAVVLPRDVPHAAYGRQFGSAAYI